MVKKKVTKFEINGVKYEGTLGEYVYKVIEAYKNSYPHADIYSFRKTFDGHRGRTQMRDATDPAYFRHPEYFFPNPITISGVNYYISNVHSESPKEDIDVFENAIYESHWNIPIKRYDRNGKLAFVNP